MPSRSLRLVNRIKKITWQEGFSDKSCTKCLPQTKFSIWKKKESLSAFRSGKKLERTFGTKRLYFPLFWQQLLEWLAENQGKIVALLSINPTLPSITLLLKKWVTGSNSDMAKSMRIVTHQPSGIHIIQLTKILGWLRKQENEHVYFYYQTFISLWNHTSSGLCVNLQDLKKCLR